jgi:RNA polymerase sigma-70 factor (ECF subfamily)
MEPVTNSETDKPGDDWAQSMAAAQSGDAAAYRRLLTAIAPYLRSIAARHHRDRADVEDSVQDILLTVHAVRHTYDPSRPFKPWLVAIARRRIIDRLRGQGRRRARETFLAPEHETFAAPETNTYEAEPDARALREAVQQLPEGQRQAVTLLKIEEKTLKEASAASGMSIVALKVSTHRAVKTLRKILERGREEK